jgi:signal transduction histidine kinase
VIEAQLDRLRAGLSDLETARGEVGRNHPEDVHLPDLVRAASAPWRGVSFRWDGEPAVARLDRRRLMKALGNVVANAAEHGDGEIEVVGETLAGRVRVQVRNRGRGLRIAAAAAEELGGRLRFEIDGEDAVATLDLPAA